MPCGSYLDHGAAKLNKQTDTRFIQKAKPPMFRAALLILSGNAAASLLLLARNLIIARLIPVADYGIAATFAIAMAVVEMMSALGLQQQIVQSSDGDDPRFQASLQGFQVLRGAITGGVLYLAAPLIADFLQVPQATWAYQIMALVPVLNALVHFDVYRMNRQMRFGPMILTGALPALGALGAVWPLAVWYGDYRVMLYSIILQAVLTALTSHLVAQRPYRLVLDRALMGQSLAFGWPLLLNGILLFAVFQGDKLIVGRTMGMETLAIFAMGFTLTLTPTLVLSKSVQNFFLPQLTAANRGTPDGEARFAHLSMVTFQSHMLFATLIVLMIMAIGKPAIDVLLNDKYAQVVPLLTWMAILQALRLFRGGPATVALAQGMTGNALIANILRVASLPLAWWVAVTTGDIYQIIAVGLAAEFLSFIVAFALVRSRVRLGLRPLVWPVVASLGTLLMAMLHALGQTGHMMLAGSLGPYVALGLTVVGFVVSFATMTDLRRYIRSRA